jgi:hypothetical protein
MVEFFDGGKPGISGNIGSTVPSPGNIASGGPVQTFEGGNQGKGVSQAGAGKSYDALDRMPKGDKGLIDTPVKM